MRALLVCLAACSTPPDTDNVNDDVHVRFVNLYASAPGKGETIDVYRRQNEMREDTPVVKRLAYGGVSDFVSPLNGGDFEVEQEGSVITLAEPLRDESTYTVNAVDTVDYHLALNVSKELPVESGGFPPGDMPNKARVLVIDVGLALLPHGDFYVGSGGQCLIYAMSGKAAPVPLSASTNVFDLLPGDFDLAIYDDCSAPPLLSPISVSAGPGSRSWIYLYGSGPSDLHMLVVPLRN